MTENEIIDAENYKSLEGGFGFKDIVMRQLSKVVYCKSQEMRPGFWVKSYPAPSMAPEKIKYFGDSREELIQATDTLHDLLAPKFDGTMKKASQSLYKIFNDWDDKHFKERNGFYWRKVLKIYRSLFQQLCLFLERLGWLESSGVEE